MMSQLKRIEPQANQESVWDYPRPPRLEPSTKRIRVVFNGITIADTTRALRILETSHPPTYYIPLEDIQHTYLSMTPHHTFCEFKGQASYYSLSVNGKISADAGWFYSSPTREYGALKNHVAFYASRVDTCYVDEERVQAQSGDFYGGWITNAIVGPFKGSPGTTGW
jgi:uncharacterized protein (DUF427 family)